MKVETAEIDSLKPAHYNPRQISREELDKLSKSIKQFGFVDPALVRKADNMIVGGHQRIRAAQELGLKEVPVIYLDISENDAKLLNVALNKISGDWEEEKLTALLAELRFMDDVDELLTGFDDDELDKLLADLEEPKEGLTDDDAIPEDVEAICKEGQLWKLGDHRLLCGDATKNEDVKLLMDGSKADMVFTDPPYGMFLETDYSKIKGSEKSIGFKGNKKGNKYDKILGDNEDFTPLLISTILDNFKHCKEIFIWGGDYFVDLLPNYGKDGSWFVWNKRSSEAQQKGIGNCFELLWSKKKHKRIVYDFEWFGFLSKDDPKEARNRLHPSMKPTRLLIKTIESYSEKNNLIADIYLGSGSTLIACEKTNRVCYGMEIDPHYCDVIIKRWEDYTGQKAELLDAKV